jgi:undecaprenyl-diphosphatase
MDLFQAVILGAVEGLTEFLPVSSTGHLILAAHGLGLTGEAVKTFEVVIQGGALAAVAVLYRGRIAQMMEGRRRKGSPGRILARNLAVSFLPAAVLGILTHGWIKEHLFAVWPVAAALALGGLAMILIDRWARKSWKGGSIRLETMTARQAFWIGLAQCFSLWPGTSRSMATIAGGLLTGLSPAAAAEYSFLLAIPTLGAATLLDAARGGSGLLMELGTLPVALGFLTAAVTAVLAVRGFVRFLTRRGLAVFGWYRIGLAVLVLKYFP